MIDEAFIQTILQKGREANEKVQLEFSTISPRQLKLETIAWKLEYCTMP